MIQQVLSPNSITRYYRIVNGDIGFGSTTTTNGQVWSNGNITHDGIATPDLWAAGSINGSRDACRAAHVKHPGQSTPINFASFLASLSDISRAASVNSPSTYFDDATQGRLEARLQSTMERSRRKSCDMTGGDPVGKTIPSPTAARCRPTTCRRTARSTLAGRDRLGNGQGTRHRRQQQQHHPRRRNQPADARHRRDRAQRADRSDHRPVRADTLTWNASVLARPAPGTRTRRTAATAR